MIYTLLKKLKILITFNSYGIDLKLGTYTPYVKRHFVDKSMCYDDASKTKEIFLVLNSGFNFMKNTEFFSCLDKVAAILKGSNKKLWAFLNSIWFIRLTAPFALVCVLTWKCCRLANINLFFLVCTIDNVCR